MERIEVNSRISQLEAEIAATRRQLASARDEQAREGATRQLAFLQTRIDALKLALSLMEQRKDR